MADAINAPEKEPEEKIDPSFNAKEQAKNMMDDVKSMGNLNVKPKDFKPGLTKGMPTALKIIQVLLILSAIAGLFGGILGIVSTVISLITVWGINKRAMWAYYLLIASIIFSVVVTLVNWISYSFVSLVIDAILLYYVTQSKKWFLPNTPA